MCKVFAMSNMSKVKINKKFLNAVRAEVCRTGDKHGFGYSVLGEDGSLGGERTMRPTTWQPLQGDPKKTVTGSLPIVLQTRDTFGDVNIDKPKSFIGHGRFSTNDVSLENTHPFYNGSLALIHNGVVRDVDNVIKNLRTTNDTEIIFRCWEQGGMPMVEKTVTGYYALAVLDAMTGLMHIVRDDTAPLYIAYSRTVDSFIFATTPEIIRVMAKKMQWHIETPEELLENIHVVLDRNEILEQNDVTPRIDTGRYMSEKEWAAFGSGDYRSGSSKHSKYEGWGAATPVSNIIDATSEYPIDDSDPEPTYREKVKESLPESESFTNAVQGGEVDRSMVDDGCPNPSFGYEESKPGNGIDDSIDSPFESTDTRKIS